MEHTTLKQKLRLLIAEHSGEEVHKTLEQIFQEDYVFLQKHCAKKEKHKVADAPPKVADANADADADATPQPKPESPEPAPLVLGKKPVKIQVRKEPMPEDKSHQQEVLEEQEKKEKEKFAELVKQGVNPESLLTKENLTDWLQTKEYSFAYIARELVGLSQAQVRYAAKAYQIESPVSIRRKGLVAGKMKGKN